MDEQDWLAEQFDEIARIEGCSPAAARQLASRARRRVQGATLDPERLRLLDVLVLDG